MMAAGPLVAPDDPGVNRVLAAAGQHGLPVNVLSWGRVAQLGPLAARNIFDAFGLDRCMWGTDWTRAVAFLTYKGRCRCLQAHRPPQRQRTRDADGRDLAEGLRVGAVSALTCRKCRAQRGIDGAANGSDQPSIPWYY
jgi:hypothetical protein